MKYSILFVIFMLVACDNSGVSPSSDSFASIILASDISTPWQSWPSGNYNIKRISISGDKLMLTVSHPGVLLRQFKLVAFEYWIVTEPAEADLLLSVAPDSLSSRETIQDLVFDLTPLKQSYYYTFGRRSFGQAFDKVHLNIKVPSKLEPRATIEYDF